MNPEIMMHPGVMGFDNESLKAVTKTVERVNQRRRISPESGHALEILGHAIAYLADELIHEGGPLSGGNERVQAIQMLMAANRQIYFACPVIPTGSERIRLLAHRILAQFRGLSPEKNRDRSR